MTARALAKLLGTFHNVSYYAREMKSFADLGLPEYWRAYMAYRSAPMGIAPASVVQSTFYNFSPSQVQAGIPSAWETTTPTDAMALRDRCIGAALARSLPDSDLAAVQAAADLGFEGIMDVEAGMRPLFAAHRELPVPTDPLMRLWFASTLWREHRGDGHNIALAAAEIDGIECHVLLAAKGVGSRDIIVKIRGWSPTDWDAAHERLVERELLDAAGEFTEAGRTLRADIERHTDQLASPPRLALGEARSQRLVELLETIVGDLLASGTVPGRWPPPKAPH